MQLLKNQQVLPLQNTEMNKVTRHIIATLLIIVPFYMSAFLQRVLLEQHDVLVEEFMGFYMLLSLVGISAVLVINKFWLKNNLNVFIQTKPRLVYDFALGFLLLGTFYFIQSVEKVTYANWFSYEVDRSAIIQLLDDVFSKFLYGIMIIGPFTWFEALFSVLSVVFVLNCLWAVNNNKHWPWIPIFLTALIVALLQINNGPSAIISSFLIISFSNIIYYKYRSVIPLLIATILFQSIDLITYWIYAN